MGYRGVGGLVGQSYGSISNSYATGIVKGQYQDIGGLVGENNGGTISNSYSTGSLCLDTGATAYGGLLGGQYSGGTTNNSYWDKTTSNQPSSAGGTGTTTPAMKKPSTFIDAGWDTDIWKLDPVFRDGYYPALYYQLVLF